MKQCAYARGIPHFGFLLRNVHVVSSKNRVSGRLVVSDDEDT